MRASLLSFAARRSTRQCRERHGGARRGRARLDTLRGGIPAEVGLGSARQCREGRGSAWQGYTHCILRGAEVWRGLARLGQARPGKANTLPFKEGRSLRRGMARLGMARQGMARQTHGISRGAAVCGTAGPGQAGHGPARHGKHTASLRGC